MDAKNDTYIYELLSDPDYRIQANGVVEKITRYRDLPLSKGQKKPVWKPVGFLNHSKIKVLYYKFKSLQIKRIIWLYNFGSLKTNEQIQVIDRNESNCQPANLTSKTISEIRIDLYQSGRKTANARLTWNQAEALRSDWKTGQYTQRKLAEKYGLSPNPVSKIVNNITYKNKRNHEEEK